ncbi:FKBP-type peptidyl-prolyl cis-trans isomerase [Confluentibacter sediminis]|uniref:FKBP-type peptidyl-prolyl cis-trans isomerase n=1 Tax=Confluentibacter sediminis TaxID=2219045 RepID=UPI0013A6A0F8|nr:hypothetical protein [Confluentibacter sediminis]
MNLEKIGLLILFLTLGLTSCKKDDDEVTPPTPPRDRGEQQIRDKDSLIGYLESHYYNSDDFVSNPNPSISDLIITKLNDGEAVPDGKTLLKDAVGSSKKTTYAETEYEFYVLNLNQGGGDSPTFADDVFVTYEGFTLDDNVFDSAVTPVTFDLLSVISGWGKVFPEFNTAESFVVGDDGSVSFMNHGLGVMFLPSGLAYFSNAQRGIPAYSPLIFKFELLQMFQKDHDGDGIPTYLEGTTENTDDDTYTSSGYIYPLYDYLDTDDDGDGILTKDEIEITTVNKLTRQEVLDIKTSLAYNQVLLNKIKKEEDNSYTGTIITFTDTDGVKPFDYLDKNN